MKKSIIFRVFSILVFIFSFAFLAACSNKDSDDIIIEDSIHQLDETQTDTEISTDALLFMLEEEKLARDTYVYLDNMWSINQFANIQKSEQTHMNAVENLLIQNNIEYTIKPAGEFSNQNLQDHYNQFVVDGAVSVDNAMQIGATIEDLDIKDLQDYIDLTTDQELIAVFEKLKCGSRNHLRSFVSRIEKAGNTYTPQFITEEEYTIIIEGSHEQCN